MKKTPIPQPSKKELKGELNELLGNIKRINKVRYFVIGGFLLFTLFQKLTGMRPVTWWLFLLLVLWILLVAICGLLLRKTELKETITRVNIFYLIFLAIETTILLMILHFGGALFLTGIVVLIAYVFLPYFSFTRRSYCWIIMIFWVVEFVAITTLEYLGILEVEDIFNIGTNIARNLEVFRTVFTTGIPILIMVFYLVDTFARRLQQREKELEGAKEVLGIKVKARTRELEEERAGLEERVKERTKELQERIDELEKFHRLTVGRELKMRELKKEIERLKKKTERR